MIRRPPRSTLFPTRRSSDLGPGSPCRARTASAPARRSPPAPAPDLLRIAGPRAASRSRAGPRSEEHTSELQSQSNLVCRLLLEKKKRDLGFYALQNLARNGF